MTVWMRQRHGSTAGRGCDIGRMDAAGQSGGAICHSPLVGKPSLHVSYSRLRGLASPKCRIEACNHVVACVFKATWMRTALFTRLPWNSRICL